MVKLIVVYPRPADPAAFDAHYFTHHASLTRKLPGLERAEFCKLKAGPENSNPHYVLAEMHFKDKDALKAAMKSPEMAACVQDVEQNLKTAISVYISEEVQN